MKDSCNKRCGILQEMAWSLKSRRTTIKIARFQNVLKCVFIFFLSPSRANMDA